MNLLLSSAKMMLKHVHILTLTSTDQPITTRVIIKQYSEGARVEKLVANQGTNPALLSHGHVRVTSKEMLYISGYDRETSKTLYVSLGY